MITEYWSIHAALPATAARRHYCALAARWSATASQSAVLSGADPRVCAEGEADDELFEVVDLELERYLEIEATASCCEVVQSDDVAALALVDRALARPRGISLLEGRPLAWLPCSRLAGLQAGWRALRASGAIGRADGVARELAAINRALETARLHRHALLLVCGSSPFGDALEGSSPGIAPDLARR